MNGPTAEEMIYISQTLSHIIQEFEEMLELTQSMNA